MSGLGRRTMRVARPEDEPEIRRCIDSAYAPYVGRMGKPPAPMLADYEQLVGEGVVRVVTRGDRIEGLIAIWPKEDHLYVGNIAVFPDAQGTGAGAALLAEADREAVLLGHDEIRLYTNALMTENLEYYPQKGFVETHRAADDGYERVYSSRRLSSHAPR